ncbi:tetratricopeptide repeat protein [bacterium]|nr:MAG: tetratricopeptide repeat protein [bacterium]
MHWRIELFGGLRAIYGSATVSHFRSRKTAALLAYLAFFRGPHPRDQLVEMLWPEFPVEAGRNSLRVALADLRRRSSLSDENGMMLSLPLLQLDYGTIGLSREVTTDVTDFERAVDEARRALSQEVRIAAYERAQSLYGGPFLRGLYESWIPVEEARLEASYLYALKALEGIYESLGDSTRAFELAQLAARLAPQPQEKSTPTKRRIVSKKREKAVAPQEDVATPPQQTAPVPAAFTRFFGREDELRELGALLLKGQTRLLTILGGGGMGKTRLAQELALRLDRAVSSNETEQFGRVLWVALADTTEAQRLPEDLIKILNLTVNTAPTSSYLQDSIARFLRGEVQQQRTLLVLDNFEQLLPNGAPFLGELLERVPNLTLVVTSRQRLNLTGEREHRIEALALPLQTLSPAYDEENETHWNKEQLAILRESSSVQLFADRARGARADWRLWPREALTLIALLHRLEGVPLAIELVASRAGVLSLEQMLGRLPQSLQWVNSRDSHRPARHRSLHAVLEWSLGLLSPQDREIFARLSVFHGGWTLDDASAVLPDVEPDVLLESLQTLRDASLINSEESGRGELRFSMLELVRQIASESLSKEQHFQVSQSHAKYYFQLAQRGATQENDYHKRWLWGSTEGSNFSAALDFWAHTDLECALEMAAALWWYWIFNYHLPEGRHSLGQLLNNPQAQQFPRALARAQRCAAYIALLSGYYDEVDGLLHKAMQVCSLEAEQNEQATLLNLLGASAVVRGDKEKARELYAQSLTLRRKIGNERELTIAINALAGVENTCGNLETARLLCAEALERARRFDDNGAESWAYNTLGCIAFGAGNLSEAREHQQRSLAMRRRHKQLMGQASCLQALGDTEFQEDNLELARTYYQEAFQLWQQIEQIPKAQILKGKLELVAQRMAPVNSQSFTPPIPNQN